jgi:hypothetical protein
MKLPGLLVEFSESLKCIGEDFAKPKTFWIPVVLCIVPCVLLATKFRSNMPQLLVSAELSHQQFASQGGPIQDRDEFLGNLRVKIQSDLVAHISVPFPKTAAPPSNGKTEQPASVPSGGKARFLVKARITNVGTLTSTISYVSVKLMESIGGRMSSIGYATWPVGDVTLPQGQITPLGNPAGQTIEFNIISNGLVDYQTVELIGRPLRERYPKETTSRVEILASYLRLLALDDFWRQERLVAIADPANQARVFLVIQVYDIYSRTGAAECPIIDCGAWK